jgi:RNA polymerase sigma-70 factor (ECF subfamily)
LDDSFDDTRLAQALRTGDPAELRVGFERHCDAMSWLAGSLTGRDQADTGPLVEELWASAVVDYAQAQPEGSARVWLFGRLIDVCIDEFGTAPEAPGFLPAEDPWEGHWREFPVPWRADCADWEFSPAGREILEDALGALPPMERAVLILRDLDAWSIHQVGALVSLPPERQRDILHQARLAIRAAMDPVLREPGPPGQPGGTGGDQGHDRG